MCDDEERKCGVSCYIMLYHIVSFYIMLYHVTSCDIMLHHVKSLRDFRMPGKVWKRGILE